MTTVDSQATTAQDDRISSQGTQLLVASALGVYLLIVVGAVTSLLEGAVACPTWPACNGRLVVPLSDPALVAAWGHRVAALVVGLVLIGTMAVAWRNPSQRVRYALGLALTLYPVQLLLGALTATTGASLPLSAAHLVIAMVIFSSVLVALLWHLEARTPSGTDESVSSLDISSESAEYAVATADPSSISTVDSGSESERGALAQVGDYLELTKPKLMWLLCLVALAAMGLAGGRSLNPATVAATLVGGVLAIGASGTFNNVLERDRDQKMARTNDRPLVEGRIPVRRAVAFGVSLTVASVAVFVTFVNVLAAALGLLAILFYSIIYTIVLKPNTTQNIVVGGAVGAFPALIGWAAVTNTVGIPALVLGAVIFLWTPAHFYNLALAYEEDYASADFPMLPVVRGEATTRRHILLYFGATMLGAVVLGAITRLGAPYAVAITVLGGVFLWTLVRQYRERTEAAALRTFHASNVYLGTLLLMVTLDTHVL